MSYFEVLSKPVGTSKVDDVPSSEVIDAATGQVVFIYDTVRKYSTQKHSKKTLYILAFYSTLDLIDKKAHRFYFLHVVRVTPRAFCLSGIDRVPGGRAVLVTAWV